MISLQQVINSSLSLRLVSALAQRLSPRTGYRIADFAAEQIARQRNSRLVQAVRANQWVVHGERLEGEALDQVVRETFHHWARCIFDLYHYLGDPQATGRRVVLESSFQPIARRAEFEARGLMVVGLHVSNFDLILQWLCRRGLKPLALTIPDPQGGRRMEYEIRKRTGMNLVPVSVGVFRQAVKYLQQGGMVVTGIDRPIPEPEACPRFFGRPAALHTHHIFLATKARVPVILAVAHLQEDGKYHVFASDPLEMDPAANPEAGRLQNAEKVLAVAEEFIRRCPQQWSMPLPVWPDVMSLVPK